MDDSTVLIVCGLLVASIMIGALLIAALESRQGRSDTYRRAGGGIAFPEDQHARLVDGHEE